MSTRDDPLTPNVLDAEELLAWSREATPRTRLRTLRDALPGGWAAAMAPLLVHWNRSDPRPGGAYLLRNFNAGGNPVEGTTLLCSARVPASGVREADFVFVPIDGLGKRGLIGHAMLRFRFHDAAPVILLEPSGEPVAGDAGVADMVLSWEAWRPPGVRFDARRGLDPSSFGLTLRAYAGSQRFLEDGMQRRDWYAYPLRMPGGDAGLDELLRVGLILGDSVARRTLQKLLRAAAATWHREAPSGDAPARWQELQQALAGNEAPDDLFHGLQDVDASYQTVQRSCATVALYTIDAAVERLRARFPDDPAARAPRLRLAPQRMEPWMEEMAHADLLGMFLRAPSALYWLIRHQEVIPSNAWSLLRDAGLLQLQEGKVVERHYKLHGDTPYGSVRQHLLH